jgi:fructokinase
VSRSQQRSADADGLSYGGIEAGGTKWVCAVGKHSGHLLSTTTFPTTTPDETLARAVEFFAQHDRPVVAIGIGAFGPLDLRRNSSTFGYITTTPKPGWANTAVAPALHRQLNVPVFIDTDVNTAALAEWRWGAATGLDTFAYVTIGTGIGVGAIVHGRLLHGLLHPEGGHMCVPHDWIVDPFTGSCPYHGDCLEGLASGEAIHQRWGRPATQLSDPKMWRLEANYVASALLNLIYILSPQRIIVGGGVAQHPTLLAMVRTRIGKLLAGYLVTPELASEPKRRQYIVPAELGNRAGVIGAVELAAMSVDLSI